MLNLTENRQKSNTTRFLLQQLQDMKMKLDLKGTVTYKNGKVKVRMDQFVVSGLHLNYFLAGSPRVGKLHSIFILPLPTPEQCWQNTSA